jgi:cobalt/nickel transport system permease protein
VRGRTAPLVLRRADGSTIDVRPEPAEKAAPGSARPFLLGGVGVTLVLAGVVSFFASSSPDGLESVGEEKGFLAQATDHLFGSWALADYGDVGGIPVGVAGVAGVGVTLIVTGVIAYAARSRTSVEV